MTEDYTDQSISTRLPRLSVLNIFVVFYYRHNGAGGFILILQEQDRIVVMLFVCFRSEEICSSNLGGAAGHPGRFFVGVCQSLRANAETVFQNRTLSFLSNPYPCVCHSCASTNFTLYSMKFEVESPSLNNVRMKQPPKT